MSHFPFFLAFFNFYLFSLTEFCTNSVQIVTYLFFILRWIFFLKFHAVQYMHVSRRATQADFFIKFLFFLSIFTSIFHTLLIYIKPIFHISQDLFYTGIFFSTNSCYLLDFMTRIWSHSTFMANFSFLEKHVNIMKTYHSYIRIVTQTCLAKYREFLKMKENSKGKYCEYEVIIQCDF